METGEGEEHEDAGFPPPCLYDKEKGRRGMLERGKRGGKKRARQTGSLPEEVSGETTKPFCLPPKIAKKLSSILNSVASQPA